MLSVLPDTRRILLQQVENAPAFGRDALRVECVRTDRLNVVQRLVCGDVAYSYLAVRTVVDDLDDVLVLVEPVRSLWDSLSDGYRHVNRS